MKGRDGTRQPHPIPLGPRFTDAASSRLMNSQSVVVSACARSVLEVCIRTRSGEDLRLESPEARRFSRHRVFFGRIETKKVCEGSDLGGDRLIGGASMCDYSLHAVATRPAEVAETLVSTKFHHNPGLCEPGQSASRGLPTSRDRNRVREGCPNGRDDVSKKRWRSIGEVSPNRHRKISPASRCSRILERHGGSGH